MIDAFQRLKDFFLVFKTNVGAACVSGENLITLCILVWIGQFVIVVLASDAFVNIKHLLKRVKGPVKREGDEWGEKSGEVKSVCSL